MTFVPLLVGSILGGFSWAQLLLAISWTLAFLFFNVFGLYVKARRKGRYVPALVTYGILAAAGAVALIIWRPSLLWWGILLSVLFAWAWWEIQARNERSLGARVSTILASCLMVPIANFLGSNPVDQQSVWTATIILALYFCGTVPYVKTLIRERGNEAWLPGSLIYHALLIIVAIVAAVQGLVTWFLVVVSIILFVRALFYPYWSEMRGRVLNPALVGMTEFFYCALVVVGILWHY